MRTILHSDMNCCYASIELLHHPELRGKPMAVGGDPEARHGIVLAKEALAKKAGVKTGMALWEARNVCPDIIFVPPHMDLYMRFSRMAREIYGEYSDQVESFGLDECWIDLTASVSLKGDGVRVAQEIRQRMKRELGVTVSVGVSWNKILAKLGSDYKKPDAVTVISPENFHELAWPLPVEDLLYVGRASRRKLDSIGVKTIGQLAGTNPKVLECLMGKMGLVLWSFANGYDQTPVTRSDFRSPIKSIGNSTTTPRDLVTDEDVKIIIYLLSESVAARLRENNFRSSVIEVSVRDNGLYSFTRQKKIRRPTDITGEIAETAMALFRAHYGWQSPIRSLGVRAGGLTAAVEPAQTSLFVDEDRRDRMEKADLALDDIRRRFGYYSVQRGFMLNDRALSHLDAKEDNVVHPRGYFEQGKGALNQIGVQAIEAPSENASRFPKCIE